MQNTEDVGMGKGLPPQLGPDDEEATEMGGGVDFSGFQKPIPAPCRTYLICDLKNLLDDFPRTERLWWNFGERSRGEGHS